MTLLPATKVSRHVPSASSSTPRLNICATQPVLCALFQTMTPKACSGVSLCLSAESSLFIMLSVTGTACPGGSARQRFVT